jgi:hypothetical protein
MAGQSRHVPSDFQDDGSVSPTMRDARSQRGITSLHARVRQEWALPFISADVRAPRPFWAISAIPSLAAHAPPGGAAFVDDASDQVAAALVDTANTVANFMCDVSKHYLSLPSNILESEGEWRWSQFPPGLMARHVRPFWDANDTAHFAFFRAEVAAAEAVTFPTHFSGRKFFLQCDAHEPVEVLSCLPVPGCTDLVSAHIYDVDSGDDCHRYALHVVARRKRDGRIGFFPIELGCVRFLDEHTQSLWLKCFEDSKHVSGGISSDDGDDYSEVDEVADGLGYFGLSDDVDDDDAYDEFDDAYD